MTTKKRIWVALIVMCGMLFGMPSASAAAKQKRDRSSASSKTERVKKLHACNAKIDRLKADNELVDTLQAKTVITNKLYSYDAQIVNLNGKNAAIENLQAKDLTVDGDAEIHGSLVVDGCVTSKCCKNNDYINPTIINVPFSTFYSAGTAY